MNESNKKRFAKLGETLTKVFPYNIINDDGDECVEEIVNECLKAPKLIDFKNKDFSDKVIFGEIWSLLSGDSIIKDGIVECYKEYLESKNYKVYPMAQLRDELAKHDRLDILLRGKNSSINFSDSYFYEVKDAGYTSFDVWKANDEFYDNENDDFKLFFLKKMFKEDFTQAGYSLDEFIKGIKDCIKEELMNF